MEEDAVYFERRASEEVVAAAKSQHCRAREAHLKIAQSYRDLASRCAPR